jgi:hypothetical protein
MKRMNKGMAWSVCLSGLLTVCLLGCGLGQEGARGGNDLAEASAEVSLADGCGAPSAAQLDQAGLFVYRECGSRIWQLIAHSSGQTGEYRGRVVADQAIQLHSSDSLETNDVVGKPTERELTFELHTYRRGHDEVLFSFPADALVQLEIDQATGPIFVGHDAVPAQSPVLISGAAQDGCGAPSIEPHEDSGLYIWQRCDSGAWEVRATAGGGRKGFSGVLTSNMAFGDLRGVQLEAHDTLSLTSDGQISFDLMMHSSYRDGFTFTFPAGASVTLRLTAGGPLLLGEAATPKGDEVVLSAGSGARDLGAGPDAGVPDGSVHDAGLTPPPVPPVPADAARPYGLWGIFGVENAIARNVDSAFYRAGTVRGTLSPVSWEIHEPRDGSFDWSGGGERSSLDARIEAISKAKIPNLAFAFYHGNNAPKWLYGAQLSGAKSRCPSPLNGDRVNDWGDLNPNELVLPSYDPRDLPPTAGLPGSYTTPPNGRDGVVPVVGCATVHESGSNEVRGFWPDYNDADYVYRFERFVRAAVARIKWHQRPGGLLEGRAVAYIQAAVGRSGDARATPWNIRQASYRIIDSYTNSPRQFYPDRYQAHLHIVDDPYWYWWQAKLWDIYVDVLQLNRAPNATPMGLPGSAPYTRMLVNWPHTKARPPAGYIPIAERLLGGEVYPRLDTRNILEKMASIMQAEGMSWQDNSVRQLTSELQRQTPRIIRGEHGEPGKGAGGFSFDESIDRFVRHRPEQEVYWWLLNDIHLGISTPNAFWIDQWRAQSENSAQPTHADEWIGRAMMVTRRHPLTPSSRFAKTSTSSIVTTWPTTVNDGTTCHLVAGKRSRRCCRLAVSTAISSR